MGILNYPFHAFSFTGALAFLLDITLVFLFTIMHVVQFTISNRKQARLIPLLRDSGGGCSEMVL
jgi:hypothetical protein